MQLTNRYVLRKILDECILVPISPALKHRDCLFVLNPTARAMYDGFKAGLSVEEIERRVGAEFDGLTPEAFQADLKGFLAQMIEIEAMHDPAAG